MKVLSRLRTATPLQVNLQVRIAEVNRSLLKEISGSLLTSRNPALGNGFLGSVIRGRTPGTITYGADGSTTYKFLGADGTNSLGGAGKLFGLDVMARSEEHTSELQSLMRISYAVFCLKKKKTKK